VPERRLSRVELSFIDNKRIENYVAGDAPLSCYEFNTRNKQTNLQHDLTATDDCSRPNKYFAVLWESATQTCYCGRL